MDKNWILKIYGKEYRKMTKTLLAKADLAALIGDRDRKIGIKPNLVTPSPADFGATTHPEIVAGIIEYLQENGFRNIVIAEGSWVGDRTAEAFEICGYRTLSETYGVPLLDAQTEAYHTVDCAGMKLAISDIVDRIDFLINVPVLKGHCQTKVTCALKNIKGLIPNREKSRFHQMGLHKPIAHLQKGIRQDFIVVDHICGDLDFEEGGNPVIKNCIMAAADPVLTDSYACYLLGITPEEVPYIGLAEKLGIGSTDLSDAKIFRIENNTEVDSALAEDREKPDEQRFLDVSYVVEEYDSCSACYSALTYALCRLKEEGLLEKLDTKIGIGQGMQGKTGKLGIGKCTKDFEYCIMGCPPDEEKVYRELKRYILGNVSHAERARELFYSGYNCAQSVFCAFTDVTGFDLDTSARLASSFGAGLGRLREVCGSVSGAAMVLGAVEGYDDPSDKNAKKEHYERVREFAAHFRESEGSIICKELLARGKTGRKSEADRNADSADGVKIPEKVEIGGEPEERTAEYYKKRPCPDLVYRAAEILEDMLSDSK